jgi:hypothetical protein
LLLLPAAVRLLRPPPAGRQAAPLQHRRLGWRQGGDRTHRRPDPRALAAGRDSAAGGFRLRPQRAHGPPIALRSAPSETALQSSGCEDNGVDYVFGLARNTRLLAEIEAELAEAAAEHVTTGQPARRFRDLTYRTLDSWSRERRVIAKAEHLAMGSNPRFVVTSLSAEEFDGRTLYEDIYCARGEMENRIKEQQLDLFADRTSAATMRANQLRLWFASFAYVLLEALRRIGLRHTQFANATCGRIRLKLSKIGAHWPPGWGTGPQPRSGGQSDQRAPLEVAMASACPYRDEYHLAYLYLQRAAF